MQKVKVEGEEFRGMSSQVKRVLRDSPVFRGLNDHELEQVAALCREEIYQPHQVICPQGEASTSFYLIVEGAVSQVRRSEAGPQERQLTLERLKPGEAFSYTAIIRPHTHAASTIAQRQTKLLAIEGVKLRLLMEKEPRLGLEVMTNIATILGQRLIAIYESLEIGSAES